jgi:hypothetical protein
MLYLETLLKFCMCMYKGHKYENESSVRSEAVPRLVEAIEEDDNIIKVSAGSRFSIVITKHKIYFMGCQVHLDEGDVFSPVSSSNGTPVVKTASEWVKSLVSRGLLKAVPRKEGALLKDKEAIFEMVYSGYHTYSILLLL